MKEIETDNNVVRKTPEKIKKGLNVLYPPSSQTTYSEYVEAIACIPDALALIEQLERERDAAIIELMGYGCEQCAHSDLRNIATICCNCKLGSLWEWQGVKEKKDG